MAYPRRKYAILTRRCESDATQWEWELVRDDQPLGARVRGGPFKHESNALAAGNAVLKEFLDNLEREQGA